MEDVIPTARCFIALTLSQSQATKSIICLVTILLLTHACQQAAALHAEIVDAIYNDNVVNQEPVLWIVAAAVRQRSDCNLTSASFWNSQIFHYVIATRASIELGQRGAVSLQDSCCVAS